MKIDVIERRRQEANSRGCEYIGEALGKYANPSQHGLYKLQCGHLQDIKRGHFLKSKYRCKQCLIEVYERSASENGLEIIDHNPTSDTDYKKYKLSCGHEKLLASYSIGKVEPFCEECDFHNRHKEAKLQGLELLNYYDTSAWMKRDYKFLLCGHIQSIKLQDVTNGKVPACVTCQKERWYKEAEEAGIQLLKLKAEKMTNFYGYKALYRLDCGCEKLISVANVRIRHFGCEKHSSRWKKPAVLYILMLESLGFTWIKIGVTSNLPRRILEYKIHSPFRVVSESTIEFPSLAEATKTEKRFHKKLKYLRIEPKLMKGYMQNGTTECYPMEHFELLNKELWGFCE